jgi:CheY-like chemotaxis protein
MNERVLFVDDEPQVLEGIQRTMHKKVSIQTAASGEEALKTLQSQGPFALVISDMRMPGMSGAQFLAKVRVQSPESVRMILSGQADLQATVEAVNDGHIYRFLSKPCSSEQLFDAISDGLKQYRLVCAEKVLLEQTLSGCVKMLIEILGMVCPASSSRAYRLQRFTLGLARALKLEEQWQWDLAAFVSQIGCVALPPELLSKVEAGQALTDDERHLYESHPDVARRLIAPIPRLEDVADIVTAQFGPFSLAGHPTDIHLWDVRSAGRLLLRCACEFDRGTSNGGSAKAAVKAVHTFLPGAPESLFEALGTLVPTALRRIPRQIGVRELGSGMILDQDLVSPKGIRLVPAGQEVTISLILRLQSIAAGIGVAEPFRVLVST